MTDADDRKQGDCEIGRSYGGLRIVEVACSGMSKPVRNLPRRSCGGLEKAPAGVMGRSGEDRIGDQGAPSSEIGALDPIRILKRNRRLHCVDERKEGFSATNTDGLVVLNFSSVKKCLLSFTEFARAC
jgi:hypothetical protein